MEIQYRISLSASKWQMASTPAFLLLLLLRWGLLGSENSPLLSVLVYLPRSVGACLGHLPHVIVGACCDSTLVWHHFFRFCILT